MSFDYASTDRQRDRDHSDRRGQAPSYNDRAGRTAVHDSYERDQENAREAGYGDREGSSGGYGNNESGSGGYGNSEERSRGGEYGSNAREEREGGHGGRGGEYGSNAREEREGGHGGRGGGGYGSNYDNNNNSGRGQEEEGYGRGGRNHRENFDENEGSGSYGNRRNHNQESSNDTYSSTRRTGTGTGTGNRHNEVGAASENYNSNSNNNNNRNNNNNSPGTKTGGAGLVSGAGKGTGGSGAVNWGAVGSQVAMAGIQHFTKSYDKASSISNEEQRKYDEADGAGGSKAKESAFAKKLGERRGDGDKLAGEGGDLKDKLVEGGIGFLKGVLGGRK